MSDEQPTKEGAGKVVLLVLAFLTLPLPIGLLGYAGYTGGRNEVSFMGMSAIWSAIVAGAGAIMVVILFAFAFGARQSTRFVVRRLGLFTLIVGFAGSLGSCVGGCIWGGKVQSREWREPRELWQSSPDP